MIQLLLALVPVLQATVGSNDALREERYRRYQGFGRAVQSPPLEPRWLEDGRSLLFRQGAETIYVDIDDAEPRRATPQVRERVHHPEPQSPHGRVPSPDGQLYVQANAQGIMLGGANLESERPLSPAPVEHVSNYLPESPWSPDGKYVVTVTVDSNEVHKLPVVDYGQALESLREVPYSKVESSLATSTLQLHRVLEPRTLPINCGAEEAYLFPLGWRAGGHEYLILRLNRPANQLTLLAADPQSGQTRVVLQEENETFIGGLDFIAGGWRNQFTALEGDEQFLWLSERDGWRHVYLYDYTGQELRRLTRGEFPVERVHGVDEAAKRVFVSANAEERLYDTHVYSVGLDGLGWKRLTEGEGDHRVQWSPTFEAFVDTFSSISDPGRSELRKADGTLIELLAVARTPGLDDWDYTPPEEFIVKAADGVTDLHGLLYKPEDFDPGQSYAVIDYIYSGPFMVSVPNDFAQTSFLARQAQSMAQMGYITFIVDPRGTTERGKEFQDASFGRIGEIEIPDHVAVLHQIAAERPYMDLERVGIYGASWGGYFALRGILTAPEVFHASVAIAPGELTELASINEPYMGLWSQNPEGYQRGLNAPLASQLEGALLLVHGTADVNAPISTTYRMVDALISADKPFDLLVLPGADHYIRSSAHANYLEKRVLSFFAENLGS